MMSIDDVLKAGCVRMKRLILTSNDHDIVATSASHHQTKFAFGNIWNLIMWLGYTKNKYRIVICGSAGQFMEDGDVRVHFVHGKIVFQQYYFVYSWLAKTVAWHGTMFI